MRTSSAVRFLSCVILATALIHLRAQAPAAGNVPAAEDLFRAIRANQIDDVKRLAANGANTKDRLQTTPLHYAALYGNAASMKVLLEGGADANAVDNRGATPLIYAAYNLEKTKLLVEHGAHVNVVSNKGTTPLEIAAIPHGNAPVVRYLFEHGAEIDPKSDVLVDAAERGDPETLKLLLAHGADVKHVDDLGETALFAAALSDPPAQCGEKVDLLLPGSDANVLNTFAGRVKNGPIALTHMSALMWTVQSCEPGVMEKLIKAGAKVNERDVRQMTPLMLAVASDYAKPETVKVLLAAGANVNAKDLNGETALDWALKYGNPAIDQMLADAGAPHSEWAGGPARSEAYQPTGTEALQRSAALLARTNEKFWLAGGGCVACHAQPLAARAYVALQEAGMNPPESMRKAFVEGMIANRPRVLNSAPFLQAGGGDYDGPLTEFEALSDFNMKPSDTTDAMVHYLVTRQERTGEWARGGDQRPPLQTSSISRTAASIRALKNFGWPARQDEFDQRIARAKHWLLEAKADMTYEKADRLLGLYYAGSTDKELRDAAQELISVRRPDGGWAQTRYLSSDAYATSLALHSLRATGQMTVSDPVYKAGVAYLTKTQLPDGSWYVRSRALKLQPYFQSGFPYNHDQWISTAATAWAVMAIAPGAQSAVASLPVKGR